MAKKKKISDIRVVDNWLPPEDFAEIKRMFLHEDTTWNLVPGVSADDSTNAILNPLNNYMFAHAVYGDYTARSNAFGKISKILEPIFVNAGTEFTMFYRIKVNLYPRTEALQLHPWHSDYNYGKMRGALLYLNTNDGYTGFADGTCIDSIENRCVFFDSTEKHHSTNCTNQQYRLTMNINYV